MVCVLGCNKHLAVIRLPDEGRLEVQMSFSKHMEIIMKIGKN